MSEYPSNGDDMIDSRDVIKAIEDLTDSGEDAELLAQLVEMEKDAEAYSFDWRYGAALIRDSYFTEYARDLAEDYGMIAKGAAWPSNCIDWEQAARDLQMDYALVDFAGVDYWIR